jgi:SAM-dependent methyltransferase
LELTWFHLGVKFSSAAAAVFDGIAAVELHECRPCGFRFFSPTLPGNGAYYADLQRQFRDYYPVSCPAFVRALQLARREGIREVMDLGCGAGYFLDAARNEGMTTHGLDLNPQAVADCRERGHEVQCCTAEAYAASRPERQFALVTSFEVMEHVPDPAAFFREAAALLTPGGYLAIAVPNEAGVHGLCSLEPHQWPPHHLTRWRPQDLRKLGEQNGLEIVSIEGDLLRGNALNFYLKLQRELEHVLGRRKTPPGGLWPGVLTLGYRLLFLRQFLQKGISLHALYRRPPASR